MDKSNDNSAEQLWWARAQTIATFVGLGVFVLQIWTLLYDRVIRLKALDPAKKASDELEVSYFRVPKLSWWSAFRGYITDTPVLTTVRGLIEAGDEYLWTSAALGHLQPQHGNLSWVTLYKAVYSQVAKRIDSHVRGTTHATNTNFATVAQPAYAQLSEANTHWTTGPALERARIDLTGTSNERYKLYDDGKLISCMRRLDKVKDDVYIPFPGDKKKRGLVNLEKAWMLRGSPCIEISRVELTALALVLGIPLKINNYTQNVSGIGPFGTGFDMIQDNGVWRLEFIHGSRLPRHASSRSSGYSVLFAKHLPFGSLPFAENKLWVQSIYISPTVLEAIRNGRAIKDGKSFGGRPLQILRSLPAAKQIDSFYHTGNIDLAADDLGSILKSNDKSVELQVDKSSTLAANWCRAVAGIAFGGLVPQASNYVATAVTYTLAGEAFGDIVGDLVDALENFINKLHNCEPEANVFGNHVAERCNALHLVGYVHYATPSRYDTQEAAAIFSRFMNLVEKIACLSKLSVDEIFEATASLTHNIYVQVIMRHRRQTLPTGVDSYLEMDLVAEINKLSSHCKPPQQCVKSTI
ncbi:hypothetical protein ACEPPN_005923 [Leptodophora sp. 'Broadleaf-Isolate-01']